MVKEQNTAPVDILVPGIVLNLTKKLNVSEIEAIGLLYNSKLYSLLEDPETDVWHYSSVLLCDLLCEELNTGNVIFPEEQ